MKKIIINADDFGYSKIFNKSILFLLEKNKIDNVSVMVNYIQDNQAEQVEKIKKYSDKLGLHVDFENIDLEKIDFYSEIERQYENFFNIFDFYPVFLDMHKYSYRKEGQEAIKKFTFKNNLFFRPFQNNEEGMTTSWKKITGSFKNIKEIKNEIISVDDNNSFVILFHPGTFDPDSKSSFNKEREEDNKNILLLNDWINENRDKYQKISYLDLKKMIKKIKKELKKYSSSERKKVNEKFFKLEKGEYGEGDIFVGVSVLDLRKIAEQFSAEIFSQIQKNDFGLLEKLIQSKIHEERMLALIFLVNFFQFTRYTLKDKKRVLKFYLKNKDFVNNWDLVDISAHKILGQAILDGLEKKEILEKLAKSKNLWHRRIAIISTLAFIRKNKFSETLKISKMLLEDREDLIHKAVGWMLREVWKRDERGAQKCEAFLRSNYQKIPRTTLRYAIEKMPEEKRQKFLKNNF